MDIWLYGQGQNSSLRALQLHFVFRKPRGPTRVDKFNALYQNFIGILKFCLNIIQAEKIIETLYYC